VHFKYIKEKHAIMLPLGAFKTKYSMHKEVFKIIILLPKSQRKIGHVITWKEGVAKIPYFNAYL
jgi:hypothetical protein